MTLPELETQLVKGYLSTVDLTKSIIPRETDTITTDMVPSLQTNENVLVEYKPKGPGTPSEISAMINPEDPQISSTFYSSLTNFVGQYYIFNFRSNDKYPSGAAEVMPEYVTNNSIDLYYFVNSTDTSQFPAQVDIYVPPIRYKNISNGTTTKTSLNSDVTYELLLNKHPYWSADYQFNYDISKIKSYKSSYIHNEYGVKSNKLSFLIPTDNLTYIRPSVKSYKPGSSFPGWVEFRLNIAVTAQTSNNILLKNILLYKLKIVLIDTPLPLFGDRKRLFLKNYYPSDIQISNDSNVLIPVKEVYLGRVKVWPLPLVPRRMDEITCDANIKIKLKPQDFKFYLTDSPEFCWRTAEHGSVFASIHFRIFDPDNIKYMKNSNGDDTNKIVEFDSYKTVDAGKYEIKNSENSDLENLYIDDINNSSPSIKNNFFVYCKKAQNYTSPLLKAFSPSLAYPVYSLSDKLLINTDSHYKTVRIVFGGDTNYPDYQFWQHDECNMDMFDKKFCEYNGKYNWGDIVFPNITFNQTTNRPAIDTSIDYLFFNSYSDNRDICNCHAFLHNINPFSVLYLKINFCLLKPDTDDNIDTIEFDNNPIIKPLFGGDFSDFTFKVVKSTFYNNIYDPNILYRFASPELLEKDSIGFNAVRGDLLTDVRYYSQSLNIPYIDDVDNSVMFYYDPTSTDDDEPKKLGDLPGYIEPIEFKEPFYIGNYISDSTSNTNREIDLTNLSIKVMCNPIINQTPPRIDLNLYAYPVLSKSIIREQINIGYSNTYPYSYYNDSSQYTSQAWENIKKLYAEVSHDEWSAPTSPNYTFGHFYSPNYNTNDYIYMFGASRGCGDAGSGCPSIIIAHNGLFENAQYASSKTNYNDTRHHHSELVAGAWIDRGNDSFAYYSSGNYEVLAIDCSRESSMPTRPVKLFMSKACQTKLLVAPDGDIDVIGTHYSDNVLTIDYSSIPPCDDWEEGHKGDCGYKTGLRNDSTTISNYLHQHSGYPNYSLIVESDGYGIWSGSCYLIPFDTDMYQTYSNTPYQYAGGFYYGGELYIYALYITQYDQLTVSYKQYSQNGNQVINSWTVTHVYKTADEIKIQIRQGTIYSTRHTGYYDLLADSDYAYGVLGSGDNAQYFLKATNSNSPLCINPYNGKILNDIYVPDHVVVEGHITSAGAMNSNFYY